MSSNKVGELKSKTALWELVDKSLSSKNLNKYNKGRNTEDTKSIINYMISALYNIKQSNKDFNETEFYQMVLENNFIFK